MARLSISEFSTYRWSLEEEVAELAQRGIRDIGIWRTKFSDFESDVGTDLLYCNQLQVSSLSWAGGFTGSCGMSHEDAIKDAKSAIRLAARIGARCLIVHPGARRGHTRPHAERLFRTALDRIIPVAADFGVTLAVELVNCEQASDWTIFETYEQAMKICERYSPQHLGYVLDLGYVGLEPGLLNRLPELSPRLTLVQLADRLFESSANTAQDNLRCAMGHGAVPLQRWFDRLIQCGYDDVFELEIHGTNREQMSYRQMIDVSLSVWEQLKNRSYSSRRTGNVA